MILELSKTNKKKVVRLSPKFLLMKLFQLKGMFQRKMIRGQNSENENTIL